MVSVIQPRAAAEAPSVLANQPALADVWRTACESLNVNASAETANTIAHDVTVRLNMSRGVRTEYTTKLDGAGLPAFTLTKRTHRNESNDVHTGDERFDKTVTIKTDHQVAIANYMAAERRIAILTLLTGLPSAEVTNTRIAAWTTGVEQDGAKVTQTMARLLDVAEAVRPCWTDIALDEGSVVDDLFHSKREVEAIEERFDELYLGNAVSWTGEVLTVGATDAVGQRAAVLIAAAHGAASSGRVVALAALDPDAQAAAGDIVSVSGSLWRLDARKRLFTIE